MLPGPAFVNNSASPPAGAFFFRQMNGAMRRGAISG